MLQEYSLKNISWGSIFAGAFVALVSEISLTLFGIAVGVISPVLNNPMPNARLGVEIWFIVSTLISFFLGSVATGRLSGITKRSIGSLHGIVVWGLVTVFSLLFVNSVAGILMNGANGVVGLGALLASGAIVNAQLTTPQVMDIISSGAIAGIIAAVLNVTASAVGGYLGAYRNEKLEAAMVAAGAVPTEEAKREFRKVA